MNDEARKNDGEDRYFVVCQICGRRFRTISASHLRAVHHYGTNVRHPVLYYNQKFGSGNAAPRAADPVPERIRKNRKWGKTSVLDALRRRHREGKPMNAGSVQQSDAALFLAARRRFGGWDAALRAIPLDPDRVRKYLRWSPKSIIEAIRRRWKRGEDISETALKRTDSRLVGAGRWRYATWLGALRAAGLDPDRFKKRRRWDKPMVLECIRRRAERSPNNIRYAFVRRSDQSLYSVANRLFGGWFPALKAAGFDPDRFRVNTVWTDDKVLATIRDIRRHYGKATASAFKAAHRGHLLDYIRHRGWTLPQARAMAGVPDKAPPRA